MTYKQLLAEGHVFDASGITNPNAFQWETKGITEVYYPVDFRVISIYVYKWGLSDCTNGGISRNQQHLYIPCTDGPGWATKVEQDLIMFPEQRGPEYWALKPAFTPPGMLGPMSGGNLAYCSDSRVKHIYHIHDRFETQAQYDMLSR